MTDPKIDRAWVEAKLARELEAIQEAKRVNARYRQDIAALCRWALERDDVLYANDLAARRLLAWAMAFRGETKAEPQEAVAEVVRCLRDAQDKNARLERVVELARKLTFEGLTKHHDVPKLIPSERLREALVEVRAVLRALDQEESAKDPQTDAEHIRTFRRYLSIVGKPPLTKEKLAKLEEEAPEVNWRKWLGLDQEES